MVLSVSVATDISLSLNSVTFSIYKVDICETFSFQALGGVEHAFVTGETVHTSSHEG